MKRQSGFTLIELIIVIVILGILAATAMPKFADLRGDANTAALKGLQGSLNSAAVIAHSTQLTKGFASGVSVTLDGGAVVTMVNGYPADTAAGIGAALNSSDYTWQSAATGVGKSLTCYMGYDASVNGAMPSIGAVSSIAGC